MATATDLRRIAKRSQITQAARKLFLSQGFAATSTDAITAEAGVSKQTLYAFFPTKLDLLAHTVYSGMGELVLEPGDPAKINQLADLRAWLIDYADQLIDNLMQPETLALLRLTLGEAFHVPELRRSYRDALPAMVLGRVRFTLELAQQKGLLKLDDPDLASRMYVGPIFTFILLDGFLAAEVYPRPDREVISRLTDLFLDAQARP